MSISQSNLLATGKRRLMLYKAIQEFPENQRIRKAYMRTYSSEYVEASAKDGVIINYNRVDELFALELDTELRQMDINVWLDAIDVDPTEDWKYAVSNALNRSGVMVFVLSPHAADDQQLLKEATTFLELGKIVLPVMHKKTKPLHDIVMQPIDFTKNFDNGLQILFRQLTGQSPVHA